MLQIRQVHSGCSVEQNQEEITILSNTIPTFMAEMIFSYLIRV